ncbi:hypothetical protein FLSI110296_07455 [Flavobacterium sinopsychrotolerans]|uniref:Uncharacterized protein n=1 Tax=Flavobacterium sinopsychrotolerans TaxID=604089 RepID=A0A1H8KPG2_9FLAO|nr:hypothetical protein SAMN04487942_1264 [Flavobacterium sinopsychrotolerans]
MGFTKTSLNLSISQKNEKYIHNTHAINNSVISGANTSNHQT